MTVQRSTISKDRRGGFPPGTYPAPTGGGPLSGVLPRDLLPAGQKIRGANIIPSLAQQSASVGHSNVWTLVWSTWDVEWIIACLDSAVSLGCNTVRMVGSVNAVFTGAMTRAQYFRRWDELSALCQARSLYLYPASCDGGAGYDSTASVPFANLTVEVVAWAAHMNTLPGIVGLDLYPENEGVAASANGLDLYTAVKAVTSLSCTFSFFTQPTMSGTLFADRADHIDFHVYYTPAVNNWDAFFTSGAVRPVLIGETGQPFSASAGSAAFFNNILAVLQHTAPHAGERLAGALVWAIRDYDTVDSNRYGVFNNDGTEKASITAAVRTWPKT